MPISGTTPAKRIISATLIHPDRAAGKPWHGGGRVGLDLDAGHLRVGRRGGSRQGAASRRRHDLAAEVFAEAAGSVHPRAVLFGSYISRTTPTDRVLGPESRSACAAELLGGDLLVGRQLGRGDVQRRHVVDRMDHLPVRPQADSPGTGEWPAASQLFESVVSLRQKRTSPLPFWFTSVDPNRDVRWLPIAWSRARSSHGYEGLGPCTPANRALFSRSMSNTIAAGCWAAMLLISWA